MRLEVVHRGKRMRLDGYVSGRRLRLSLGTANGATAETWKNKIARALEGGRESTLWGELRCSFLLRRFARWRESSDTKRVEKRRSQPGPRLSLLSQRRCINESSSAARDDDV